MSDIKTKSTEIIHTNPRWQYKKDKIILPSGENHEYYYAEGNGGSIVVPITDDGRLVLVRQYRYLFDKISTEFPVGASEINETPLDTATRELLEETGYVSTNIIKVGIFGPEPSSFKTNVHIFIADEIGLAGQSLPEITGDLEVIYRRFDEFDEMVRRGEIWNGPTLAAWAMAREQVLKIITRLS